MDVQSAYFAQTKSKTGETLIVETRDIDEESKKADERKSREKGPPFEKVT